MNRATEDGKQAEDKVWVANSKIGSSAPKLEQLGMMIRGSVEYKVSQNLIDAIEKLIGRPLSAKEIRHMADAMLGELELVEIKASLKHKRFSMKDDQKKVLCGLIAAGFVVWIIFLTPEISGHRKWRLGKLDPMKMLFKGGETGWVHPTEQKDGFTEFDTIECLLLHLKSKFNEPQPKLKCIEVTSTGFKSSIEINGKKKSDHFSTAREAQNWVAAHKNKNVDDLSEHEYNNSILRRIPKWTKLKKSHKHRMHNGEPWGGEVDDCAIVARPQKNNIRPGQFGCIDSKPHLDKYGKRQKSIV